MIIFAHGLLASAQNFKSLYLFAGPPDGANPIQSNLLNVNGTIYGTTSAGGLSNAGTIIKLGGGKETVVYSFTGGLDGNEPSMGLTRDSQGNFYGTTFFGGDSSCLVSITEPAGCGVVFKFDPSFTNLTVLHTFEGGVDGAVPEGLVIDSAGNLYGVTLYGGTFGLGLVFKISATGAFSKLYAFSGGADGGAPWGTPTIRGSVLYGGTSFGGNLSDCDGGGCGVIFAVSTVAGREKTLYAFTGGTDGAFPTSQFLFDSKGNLYGTAYGGGHSSCSNQNSIGCGVIFQITPAGIETALYAFNGVPDGANPTWGMTADARGNLYGTTRFGGVQNLGAVFEFRSKHAESLLHSFAGADGSYPQSGLLLVGTSLISSTVKGGDLACNSPDGCGTLFEILP